MAEQKLPPHWLSGRWTETGNSTIQFSPWVVLGDYHFFFVCAIFAFLLLFLFLPSSHKIWIQIILVWVLTSQGSLKIKCWLLDPSARVAIPPNNLFSQGIVKCCSSQMHRTFFKVKGTKVWLFLYGCFCSGPDATVIPKHLDWVWDISLSLTLYRQLSFSLSFVSKTTVICCLSKGESLLSGCSSSSHSWWYW